MMAVDVASAAVSAKVVEGGAKVIGFDKPAPKSKTSVVVVPESTVIRVDTVGALSLARDAVFTVKLLSSVLFTRDELRIF